MLIVINEFFFVIIFFFDLVLGVLFVNVLVINLSMFVIKIYWGLIGVELCNGIILGYCIVVGMLNLILEYIFIVLLN